MDYVYNADGELLQMSARALHQLPRPQLDTKYYAGNVIFTGRFLSMLLADEENERLRHGILYANGAPGQDKGGGQGNGNGQDTPVSPLTRCDVTVSGSMVTVTYDLTEDASVTGIVSTVSGMLLRQHSQHSAEGTDYQMRIDCAGLRRGQYVLYMKVNSHVTTHTVTLK